VEPNFISGPNWNEANWVSGCALVIKELVEWPLARVRDGRRSAIRLRGSRYGLGISAGGADCLTIVDGESIIIDSSSGDWRSEASSMSGVVIGVGDFTSRVVNKGALIGSGEMSIDSCIATGEDVAGKGGVVMACT